MTAELSSIVGRWADRAPDALAVEFEGATQSYAECFDAICATAAALVSSGIGVGDRVAWLGPNRPSALHLLFGCARIGAIYLPLNSRLTPTEHAWILGDAQPSVLVCDPAFTDHAREALSMAHGAAACRVVALDDSETLASQGRSVGDDKAADVETAGDLSAGVLLAYTSGTTGHPKGALLSQRALLANAVNSTHAHDLSRADRVLTVIPLFHVGGLNIQTVPALLAGAAVLLHRAFDPGAFIADTQAWRPTWSVLVPAALDAVSRHPSFREADLSSLRGLMTGSSPVPAATTKPYFDRGLAVGEIYGATETAPIAAHIRADEAADHPGSCGKASSLCEVRVVRPDGDDVAPGERGEIWVRGPTVLLRYWRNATATAEALVDGWYRTGDVAHQDADGWLYVDDRLSDMVISGGENVYPAEIEDHLASWGELAEFAVVGAPHERWGEVPVLIAVRADDSSGPEAGLMEAGLVADAELHAKVRAHLDGKLASFKLPAQTYVTATLPRTALGKVRKNVLAEWLANHPRSSTVR